MSHSPSAPRSLTAWMFDNSMFLMLGAATALVWANWDHHSYEAFIHGGAHASAPHETDSHEAGGHEAGGHEADSHEAGGHEAGSRLADGVAAHQDAHAATGHMAEHGQGKRAAEVAGPSIFSPHFLVNDLLMALFFAMAAKEVWESLLPGGALSNPRKAAIPLMATLGGILGPVVIYLGGAALTGQLESLGRGWAIPCATDIAFSLIVARAVFGVGHPAIAFLLLLAIADDAAGLAILAVAYPSKPIVASWLLLTLAAIGVGLAMKRKGVHNFWWYLGVPGVMSWLSFYWSGIHPALGLVPIIPCLPSAKTDLGLFAPEEMSRRDTLSEFEHWWHRPVELILGLFGLCNAGVQFNVVGTGTWLVLGGLLIGKPMGIFLFTYVSEKALGLEMPRGMTYRHVLTLGVVAAIGFTVALFVSAAAFPTSAVPAAVQDAAKMGALLSLGAAVAAIAVAKALGIERWQPHAAEEGEGELAEPALVGVSLASEELVGAGAE